MRINCKRNQSGTGGEFSITLPLSVSDSPHLPKPQKGAYSLFVPIKPSLQNNPFFAQSTDASYLTPADCLAYFLCLPYLWLKARPCACCAWTLVVTVCQFHSRTCVWRASFIVESHHLVASLRLCFSSSTHNYRVVFFGC